MHYIKEQDVEGIPVAGKALEEVDRPRKWWMQEHDLWRRHLSLRQ